MQHTTITSAVQSVLANIKTTIRQKINAGLAALNTEAIQKSFIFGLILVLLLIAANLDALF
ncbi:MAG: hypothetical protein H6551_11830 [Chitinophagales bacterium]|nr:hypothetical protein [Chitinophagaceae bacterium]MCB9065818.1 hypothetical protein [Chitinophagales bacterium]